MYMFHGLNGISARNGMSTVIFLSYYDALVDNFSDFFVKIIKDTS
jgi:hypothetical protein